MAGPPIRDPLGDHLLAPQNAALVVIDYQPSQFAAVRRRLSATTFIRLTKETPMRLLTVGLTTILATLALASSTFAATNANTLTGTVGPGFTISMNKKTVKAGTYVITIHDLASIHDFHLTGARVDKKTSVPGSGTTKWTVKLKKGTYHFVCDPHRTIMHGVLKVT